MNRSKLLVEAKTIYDQVMGMDINKQNQDLLRITNIQIMGLEALVLSLNTAGDHLYIASSIESYTLLSTASQFQTESESVVGKLFDFKNYTLNTADIIKQKFNDKKEKETKIKLIRTTLVS
ncbi:hypothetical protein MFLAVUS_010678 [Mucor flavus]|uniref:Single-stranded DNA binding protein n=1 Tax=Mucor flavus TaxID=439312 RepID=A0ABP9ZDG6_9FUNG